MLTGVTYRTGVAPALLSDGASAAGYRPDRRPDCRSIPPLRLPQMRFRPIGLLLSGVVVASSACSMDATAPSSPVALAPSAPAVRAAGRDGGSDWNGGDGNGSGTRSPRGGSGADEATSTYAVTIDPRRENVLRFGDYTLTLPANAICSEKSGYGLEAFDLSCKSEKEPVTITALVRSQADAVPRIDLMPEMRFNPKLVVTLSLTVPDIAVAGSSPRILYCATPSVAACVDEALLDPTLATHVDAATNTVFRRIKHFSGYFVEW